MGANVNITLVEAGDVIAADGSWTIEGVERNDHKRLTIRQSFKDVADPNAPLVPIEGGYDGYYRPSEMVVDLNGPAVGDSGGLVINGEVVSYADIVAREGISVAGKKFLVTEVEKQDKMRGHSPGDRSVIARELDDKYEIVTGGLTVLFDQRAKYSAGMVMYDVNVVGRREPVFAPFVPRLKQPS